MGELKEFVFESREVRVVMDEQGVPWWVAKDVCEVLEIADHHQAVETLDEDEVGKYKVPTPGGEQEAKCLSEFGLYTLIMRSNKPRAKAFRRWVTHEVLPAIRKTGAYALAQDPIGMVEAGRKYEYIARLFRAIKSICMTAGLRGRNAVARANDLTLEETGFDCVEFVGLKAEYIPEDTHLQTWLSDRCDVGTYQVYAFTRDLYGDYLAWCEQADIRPHSLGKFVSGIKKIHPTAESWTWKRRGVHYKGLRGIHLKAAGGGHAGQ